MVPVCSRKEGEVASLTRLVIETQVVFWSPVDFLLLCHFAAAVSLPLHVAHPAPCPGVCHRWNILQLAKIHMESGQSCQSPPECN